MKAQLGAPSNSRTLQQTPHLLQQQRVCSSRRSAPPRQQAFNKQTAVDSLEDLEIAVPVDQRPVNELSALKEAFLYKDVRHKQQVGTYVLRGVRAPHTVLAPLQATLPLNAYLGKLGLVFGVTFAILAAPIANQTFPFSKEVCGQAWCVRRATGSCCQVQATDCRFNQQPFQQLYQQLEISGSPSHPETHKPLCITVCFLVLLHALCLPAGLCQPAAAGVHAECHHR